MTVRARSARELLEVVTNLALLTGVLVLMIIVVRQQLTSKEVDAARNSAGAEPPKRVSQWAEVLAAGRESVDSAADITVAVFLDAECPYCARFESTLEQWRRSTPLRVSSVTLHFPLPQHRFARPAARALECARVQGGFERLLAVLLAKQDSLGLLQWREYARRAKISNLTKFDDCNAKDGPIAGVDEGVALGKKLSIAGTPAVLVNGYLYRTAPSVGELERVAKAIQEKKRPFDG